MRMPFAMGEAGQLREVKGTLIEPQIGLHRSPGLQAALSRLDEDRRCHVLDLGPAVAQNVEFFARFPCRLQIVDLLGILADEPESAARFEHRTTAFLERLLPGESQPVDLILAWTVFDHIDREAAHHLSSRLARLTRPGGRLYALVATRHSAVAAGLAFAICDRDTLQYRPAPAPKHCSASFNPADFAQLLSGFAISHSVVLRHGFQEYVAVRGVDPHR